ncbi:MAG TPA: cyclic nucleotide-binding domain-containing protein [Geothrix sp.]|jgi:CRP-like cAMP-binding protein|nr:cyclic nucleotide-binding domain-containing protein [Geothrix sp.]
MTNEAAQKRAELSEFLNKQNLCESLTLREVDLLLDFTELVEFKKGQIIADIGEVGEALYFVVKGEAALFYENQGQQVELARVREGELMGEMSFFDREPRSGRLLAMRPETRMLRLSRVMYQRLRVEHPYIAVNILEHAIVSLDRLFRRVSQDVATYSSYVYGGKK